jgi:MinD-like ATPase involved in chromosome partitioning or flagellar assembly
MNDTKQQPNDVREERSPRPPVSLKRVLVACQVGMTGKTTVATNVLHARLGGRLFSIDSVNQGAAQYGKEVEAFFSHELYELRLELTRATVPVVVDLGASEFSQFVMNVAAAAMEASFDYVVIVTDTSRRSQEEAITTYQTLRGLGMPNEAFRFLLNKSIIGREMAKQYSVLFAYKKQHPLFPLNEDCYLPQHDLFRALVETGQSHDDALNDTNDYEQYIQQAELAGDFSTSIALSRKAFAQALAQSMEEYFDRAYNQLRIHS